MTADTEGTLYTAHAGAFLIGFKYLLFPLFGILYFWIKHAASIAVFASILLIAKRILAVFNNVLTLAAAAASDIRFYNHEQHSNKSWQY